MLLGGEITCAAIGNYGNCAEIMWLLFGNDRQTMIDCQHKFGSYA